MSLQPYRSLAVFVLGIAACRPAPAARSVPGRLPLVLVADVELPGAPSRFDYQDLDAERGRLVIAHMNDSSVVVVDADTGATRKVLANIPTPRGVAVAREIGRIFVTSSPSQLVVIDAATLDEVARVGTGQGPDGVAWDPAHRIVGVSDQRDGALSLLADAGLGKRASVPLGIQTGNVAYDAKRAAFWITVAGGTAADKLVRVDAVAAKAVASIALSGCTGAHGLRIHPDGTRAFVACEGNDKLARVTLDGDPAIVFASTGAGPDVLAIDPSLGWIYVASESGDLVVFDFALTVLSREHPGDHAHSVAVDPATHRVFFPLEAGANRQPTLRIMRPNG